MHTSGSLTRSVCVCEFECECARCLWCQRVYVRTCVCIWHCVCTCVRACVCMYVCLHWMCQCLWIMFWQLTEYECWVFHLRTRFAFILYVSKIHCKYTLCVWNQHDRTTTTTNGNNNSNNNNHKTQHWRQSTTIIILCLSSRTKEKISKEKKRLFTVSVARSSNKSLY